MDRAVMFRRTSVALSALIVGLALIGALSNCDSTNDPILDYKSVSAQKAATMIADNPDLVVVDVREKNSYCEDGAIPGSINMPWDSGILQQEYETLDPTKAILVVAENDEKSGQAAQFLADKNFHELYSMRDGMSAWSGELAYCPHVITVTPDEALAMFNTLTGLVIVDVRENSEFCDHDGQPPDGHIPGAQNMPWNSGVLQAEYPSLVSSAPTLVVCKSGGRSATASQFLVDNGFAEVYTMTGGMTAWSGPVESCE
jgi:rhodanese-related sulfurtransferase